MSSVRKRGDYAQPTTPLMYTWRKSFDERPNDASRLTHVRICITFDDRTKTDMTWDGPYHNGVSRSRIVIRVSFPVHICDHDTRRRYGYDRYVTAIRQDFTRATNFSIRDQRKED
ncbi:hypothetical protein SFRURICE_004556 [Spodoptera frugiperda]|nr:hypothetical protein SFRURICE_004556 [Spodoptera frugiperda]